MKQNKKSRNRSNMYGHQIYENSNTTVVKEFFFNKVYWSQLNIHMAKKRLSPLPQHTQKSIPDGL